MMNLFLLKKKIQENKVAAFGDSIMQRRFDGVSNNHIDNLVESLNATFYGRFALGGTNIYHLSLSLPDTLLTMPKCTHYFIGMGTNRGAGDDRVYYRICINDLLSFGALPEQIYLISTPFGAFTSQGTGQLILGYLDDMVNEFNCKKIDIYTPMSWDTSFTMMADDWHPNELGYEFMTNLMLSYFNLPLMF